MIKNDKRQFASLLLLLTIGLMTINCSSDSNNGNTNGSGVNNDNDSPGEELEKGFKIPTAIFNDPKEIRDNGISWKILDQMIKSINATPENEKIYLNVYGFGYTRITEALIKAQKRGVTLNLMIDSSKSQSWDSNKAQVEKLRSVIKEPSKLILFHNDIAGRAIDHHKYALFSKLKFSDRKYKNVIFSTSENFSKRQAEVLQDGVIVSDNSLYNAFKKNWLEMENRAKSGMKDYELQIFGTDKDKVQAYFYPRRKNGDWDGEETVINILNQLDEDDYKNTSIKIGMSQWSAGDLQMNIANKLIDIVEGGGHVEVITRDETSSIGLNPTSIKKLKELGNAGAYVKFLPNKHVIHSKYMLIKGVIDEKRRRLLLTGTLNFINPATKYNNNLVLIFRDDPFSYDFFDEYEKHYEDIKDVFF